MYLKHKLIKFLEIKNKIFVFVGIFNITVSIYCILSLIAYYHDRLETVLYATATNESIYMTIIGVILLVTAYLSRRFIKDANFYSSYFEHDLDGYIKYSDLAEVTGKNEIIVKLQLKIFNKIYMKGYKLKKIKNIEQIVLNSKKYSCQCKHCGAPIEKKVYFTGVCSYCGSLDLFAKVITNNQFYSIETNKSKETRKPEFYTAKHIKTKKTLTIIFLSIIIFFISLLTIIFISNIYNYNNKDYLTKLLLSGTTYSSFELIKKEIIDTLIFTGAIIAAFIPVIIKCCKKIRLISKAEMYSRRLARCKKPFISIEKLAITQNKKETTKNISKSIRTRYLLNCTFEKHDDELKLALAKKIVKDKCPTCSAPIVGAVDENYKCKYCRNIIMEVIVKK